MAPRYEKFQYLIEEIPMNYDPNKDTEQSVARINEKIAGEGEQALLPCPFCGSDDIRFYHHHIRPYYMCWNCEAQIPPRFVEGQEARGYEAEAIQVWNKRSAETADRVHELANQCQALIAREWVLVKALENLAPVELIADGNFPDEFYRCHREHYNIARKALSNTEGGGLMAEVVDRLEDAERWLSGWASAEPYISKIRATLTKYAVVQQYVNPWDHDQRERWTCQLCDGGDGLAQDAVEHEPGCLITTNTEGGGLMAELVGELQFLFDLMLNAEFEDIEDDDDLVVITIDAAHARRVRTTLEKVK